jgi:WD40 repeat protein
VTTGSDDGTVRLWDETTGKESALVFKGFREVIRGVAFCSDDLLAISTSAQLLLVEPGKGDPVVLEKRVNADTAPIAVSPDGKRLASGDLHGKIYLWDVKSKELLRTFSAADIPVYALAFSPDGALLASGGGVHPRDPTGAEIHLWNVDKAERAGKLEGHGGQVRALAFSQDGLLASAGGGDRTIRLWDVKKAKQVGAIDCIAWTIAFSPRGQTLASCAPSGTLALWDAKTQKQIHDLTGAGANDIAVAFSPDGKRLATVGDYPALRIWDVESGKPVSSAAGHVHGVYSLAFSPDGGLLASRGGEQSICLWDPSTGEPRRQLPLGSRNSPVPDRSNSPGALSFTSDSRTLAAIGFNHNKKIRIWEVAEGKLLAEWENGEKWTQAPNSIALSPEGKVLAAASDYGVRLHSPDTGKELAALQAGQAWSVAVSPDGRFLATGDYKHVLRIWDLAGQRLLREIDAGESHAHTLRFSTDGRFVASAGEAFLNTDMPHRPICLWEVASGRLVRKFATSEAHFVAFALSPDGRTLAAAKDGSTSITVRSVFTGEELVQLKGHSGAVLSLAYSPDGKTLASGSADTTILLWDVSKLDARLPAASPSPKELDDLWSDLKGGDAERAFQAVRTLIAAGDETATLIQDRMPAVAEPDAKRVGRLIKDLDDDAFAVRDAAAKELAQFGEVIEPALKRALAAGPSVDAKSRLEELLGSAASDPFGEKDLRLHRALLVLEQLGSPAARKCLEGLARGAPAARLTRDAKAALDRLERRGKGR